MKPSVKLKCVLCLIGVCVLCIWMDAAGLFSFFSKRSKINTHASVTPQTTPPMGWNSWNYFRCDGLHEDVVKGVADALLDTGLAEAGYIYVNLDDCWQIDRNASGYIMADRAKFPSGMKSLADYLHSKGLRFGIYTDVGALTCEKRPGSLNHEAQDIASYSSWGVDYIKNDDCWMYPALSPQQHYARFMQALLAAPRTMIHSIKGSVPVESAQKYGHIRRIGSDVYEEWGSVIALLDKVVSERLWESGRAGFWHDMDMLEVGNGNMTLDENVCHMILWCAFKSPLLMGNNIRAMSKTTLSLLTHDELLAIDQDPLGRSVRLAWQGCHTDGHGQAGERVVSVRCDVEDRKQQWRYVAATRSMESVGRGGSCLAVKRGLENRRIAVVKKCDEKDPEQRWHLNQTSGQIELVGTPLCLTTNTNSGIVSHIRGCRERQTIPHYRGRNQAWFYYNDAFEFIDAGDSAVLIKNSAKKCPSVGDHDELQIFTGPLSNNRYVAVLLNRDEIQHDITLQREHFSDLHPDGVRVELRDAYLRVNVGVLQQTRGGYTTSLRPHSALAIVATVITDQKN